MRIIAEAAVTSRRVAAIAAIAGTAVMGASAAVAVLGASAAFAAPDASPAVVRRVNAAGYPRIAGMAIEKGLWEVEARDAAGRKARLRVDPVSGAVGGMVATR
jgi:hypothetical protein